MFEMSGKFTLTGANQSFDLGLLPQAPFAWCACSQPAWPCAKRLPGRLDTITQLI
jgi:hypothetical protein